MWFNHKNIVANYPLTPTTKNQPFTTKFILFSIIICYNQLLFIIFVDMKINMNISYEGEINLNKIREVAMKNGLKKSKPDLIELSIKIASNTIEMLDDESFQQVNNLKK